MKAGFYPRLAFDGMRKNKKLYYPYLITCVCMVMMHYIITFLSSSELLQKMPGGAVLESTLGMGSIVILVFSAIFLFYSSSFLLRRRKKEFGLFNILGMGKRNLAKIVFWESLATAAAALICGLFFGIVLSKLAELCLLNILGGEVSFTFTVSVYAIWRTIIFYILIFFVIFLFTLLQIRISNPIALLHSENLGEKPPKANRFFAVLGALILAAAYYIAVSIKEPLSALTWFFIAVIMVIIGTYLLFIAGSVFFCRILQKKKGYYYRADHFVSVSSMVYRMKRNGAGLASICILATMVLVMISSTTTLYFGAEDSLRSRFPRDINIDTMFEDIGFVSEDNIGELREAYKKIAAENNIGIRDIAAYRFAEITGRIEDGVLSREISERSGLELDSNLWNIVLIPLSDFNRLMGTNESLNPDEVLIYTVDKEYPADAFALSGDHVYRVKEVLNSFFDSGSRARNLIPALFVVVPELETALEPLGSLNVHSRDLAVDLYWYFGFDTDVDDEAQISLCWQIKALSSSGRNGVFIIRVESLAAERADFYNTYGSLFFLGIILSLVFIFAAVLIIYYKQISEGYEDQARFEIMQKVGMTKKEIRKSINSQLLTVFFLPLIFAGLHLAFAFPMISKLLLLFNLNNVPLFALTTIVSFLVFAFFYTAVYRVTSNAYYNIVSEARY